MGRAFAEALAQMGADLAVHHHGESSKADAEETAGLVLDVGTEAIITSGDLADTGVVRAVFETTTEAFGRVDMVINNAGLVIKKPFVDITEDDFDASFAINAKAAFFVMQEAARRIEDGGRIINMGTTILGATIPFYSVYAGAKAALEDFTHPCLPPAEGYLRRAGLLAAAFWTVGVLLRTAFSLYASNGGPSADRHIASVMRSWDITTPRAIVAALLLMVLFEVASRQIIVAVRYLRLRASGDSASGGVPVQESEV